ncbi:uncharacterized protein LOC143275403 [Babylonia areolata]|uniref:uncharacterized protein LOC143275403 n=1 Tax=Babylonia areolata TaxID=304850 RepID=UPI003FD08097
MGKVKSVSAVTSDENDGEWLSTRNKKKVQISPPLIKTRGGSHLMRRPVPRSPLVTLMDDTPVSLKTTKKQTSIADYFSPHLQGLPAIDGADEMSFQQAGAVRQDQTTDCSSDDWMYTDFDVPGPTPAHTESHAAHNPAYADFDMLAPTPSQEEFALSCVSDGSIATVHCPVSLESAKTTTHSSSPCKVWGVLPREKQIFSNRVVRLEQNVEHQESQEHDAQDAVLLLDLKQENFRHKCSSRLQHGTSCASDDGSFPDTLHTPHFLNETHHTLSPHFLNETHTLSLHTPHFLSETHHTLSLHTPHFLSETHHTLSLHTPHFLSETHHTLDFSQPQAEARAVVVVSTKNRSEPGDTGHKVPVKHVCDTQEKDSSFLDITDTNSVHARDDDSSQDTPIASSSQQPSCALLDRNIPDKALSGSCVSGEEPHDSLQTPDFFRSEREPGDWRQTDRWGGESESVALAAGGSCVETTSPICDDLHTPHFLKESEDYLIDS